MTPNITKIIQTMSNIVADVMTSFQSDFENFDRPYIENADNSKFPMIWIVGKSHTHLLNLGEYEEHFSKNEVARYAYVQGGNPFFSFLDALGGDHLFLIEPDGVREITEKQAREVCRDIVTPVTEKWMKENGPLPTRVQVPVKFFNITLSKVKELIRECEAHNDNSLIEIFRRFHNYRRVATDQYIQISYNPGYNEFTFCEYTNGKQGLVGGIIFHGWPETGYMVNGSYQMGPTYDWLSHTLCNEMKPWEPYFPEHVCLYYVDYNSNLDGDTKQLQKCIEDNNLYPISESINEWWDFPEGQYLEDMQRAMENDDIEWDDDWRDEIIEALREKDESDPIKDLIRNTSDLHCYFDLGYDVDEPFGADEEEQEEEIDGICKVLKIAKDSPMREKIAGIYYNASYGGSLRIYFPAGLMTLLTGNGWDSANEDFKTIKFKGKFRVVIIDTVNGSGDFEDDVELDVEYDFDRALLGMSDEDHYGFEEIFGDDCGISHCETPTFEKASKSDSIHVDSEPLRQEREKQQKYNETFQAGKCTYGDTDMNRHRDIKYSNSYPCGWSCPHCGMFWTD